MQKRKCSATTKQGTRCSKPRFPLSRYCWHHQDPSAWIIGVLVSALVSVGITYLAMIQAEERSKRTRDLKFAQLKPKIKIDISESSPSQVAVTISSTRTNANKIEDLYFTFDIPGRFKAITREHKDRVGHCSVVPSFLVGNHWGTLADTIHVECRTLYPLGSYSFTVDYSPTEISEEPPDDKYPQRNMFLDLHDYPRVFWFWTFDGQTQHVRTHLDLRHLSYIRKDNAALVRAWRNERFHEYLRQHGRAYPMLPHEAQWNEAYQDQQERERAGLTKNSQP